MQVVLNPTDVLPGGIQNLTVSLQETDGNPATAFSGMAITDNVSTLFSFTLVTGTAHDGIWEGSWVMPNDTYCNTYQIVLLVTSVSKPEPSNATISFR